MVQTRKQIKYTKKKGGGVRYSAANKLRYIGNTVKNAPGVRAIIRTAKKADNAISNVVNNVVNNVANAVTAKVNYITPPGIPYSRNADPKFFEDVLGKTGRELDQTTELWFGVDTRGNVVAVTPEEFVEKKSQIEFLYYPSSIDKNKYGQMVMMNNTNYKNWYDAFVDNTIDVDESFAVIRHNEKNKPFFTEVIAPFERKDLEQIDVKGGNTQRKYISRRKTVKRKRRKI